MPPLCPNGQLPENACPPTFPLAATVPLAFPKVKVMVPAPVFVVFVPVAVALTVAFTAKFEPLTCRPWSVVSVHVFVDVIVSVTPFPDPVTVALPSTVCSALPIVSPVRFQVPTGHAAPAPGDTGGNVTPVGRHAVPMIANAPRQATAMSLRAVTFFMVCSTPVFPQPPGQFRDWRGN